MANIMKHSFSNVPKVEINRATFDQTHTHKTTINGGGLYVIYTAEVLPGQTDVIDINMMGRLATPIAPMMDNLYLDTHSFFVPLRLVQEKFQRMMGEQLNPGDPTDFTVPQLKDDTGNGFQSGSIHDYMGLPIRGERRNNNGTTTPEGPTGLSVSAYWHRSYNLIWNEFFRDQNLQQRVPVPVDQGPDLLSENTYNILPRGKRHDYFTSALPFPQKGPGVELPIGSTSTVQISGIPVSTIGGEGLKFNILTNNPRAPYATSGGPHAIDFDGQTLTQQIQTGTEINKHNVTNIYGPGPALVPLNLVASGQGTADYATTTGIPINELRKAFQLQKLFEKDARSGTRYTEIIKGHFNVTSPDARLQRPEYLGGGTTPVEVTPVAQTAPTDQQNGTLGTLGSFGTVSARSGYTKSFTEHGVIITLASLRADLTYQRGIPRMFSRKTKYDFYWPTLAHLGEQEILNKEIYAEGDNSFISGQTNAGVDGVNLKDNQIFGYQERWSEYRYYPSKITGKFRSIAPGSLDIWHLSEDYSDCPTLSADWIADNPPIKRIVATPTEPDLILDCYIVGKVTRPMPTYSVPGMVDHF